MSRSSFWLDERGCVTFWSIRVRLLWDVYPITNTLGVVFVRLQGGVPTLRIPLLRVRNQLIGQRAGNS